MIKAPIMIFAAGLGTRMRHLVADRPKPLITVGNMTLLDHALGLTRVPGITGRVVNTHFKAEMIGHHLAGQDVAISHEAETLLDTGGGLRNAMPILQGNPVATLNSDAIWRGPNPISALLSAWESKMEALLMLVPGELAIGHAGAGDFTIANDGQLARGGTDIYTGLQLIRTERFVSMPSGAFSMNVIWDQMALDDGLYGLRYGGRW